MYGFIYDTSNTSKKLFGGFFKDFEKVGFSIFEILGNPGNILVYFADPFKIS